MDAHLDDAFESLADDQLLFTIQHLAADERRSTARLIAALAEMDGRRLYLGQGCASLFTYCTGVLHLSEHAAYNRIAAARATRRFPSALTRLANGDLTLTTLCLMIPVLTAENCERLIASARHKSKREVERLVAGIRPQPDAASVIRKLPSPRPAYRGGTTVVVPAESASPDSEAIPAAAPGTASPSSPATASLELTGMRIESILGTATDGSRPAVVPPARAAARPAVVAALTADRYKIQFTASRETCEKLERARDLLRHAIPGGDVATVFDRALDALLANLSRKKLAAAERPQQQAAAAQRTRH